jgi:hypothetical protein
LGQSLHSVGLTAAGKLVIDIEVAPVEPVDQAAQLSDGFAAPANSRQQ